ncbi:MAG: hypothetical protein ACE14T_04925 [Syntrophales bacterium]
MGKFLKCIGLIIFSLIVFLLTFYTTTFLNCYLGPAMEQSAVGVEEPTSSDQE